VWIPSYADNMRRSNLSSNSKPMYSCVHNLAYFFIFSLIFRSDYLNVHKFHFKFQTTKFVISVKKKKQLKTFVLDLKLWNCWRMNLRIEL
jgi:hypothetical protein